MLAVIAPSFAPDRPRMDAVTAMLQDEGVPFRVFGPMIPECSEDLYAASAEIRAKALRDAFADPEINVIWAIRGGAGAAELLPLLHFGTLDEATPPALVGYSDITALHLAIMAAGAMIPLVHTSTLSELALRPPADAGRIKDLMRGLCARRCTPQETAAMLSPGPVLTPLNEAARRAPALSGKLTGGNMTLLQHALGTPYLPDLTKAALLLEDWDEPAYAFRRRFEHLRQAGVFARAAFVIFGDVASKEGGKEQGERLILEAAERLDETPVFRACGIGHCGANRPLPLGALARLERSDEQGGRICRFEYHFSG